MLQSRDDLRAFVASLRIPESRRALVELELLDHLESRIEAELAAGASHATAEAKAFAALGDREALRASLERVEPAFELAPRRAAARGAASSAAASLFFAIIGGLLPRTSGATEFAMFSLVAAAGLPILWVLAPRGIGSAFVAETRASIEPRPHATTRRRAVFAYLWSMLLVPYLTYPASFFTPRTWEDIMYPAGLVGLLFSCWALTLMRRARQERAAIRAGHGA